MGNVHEVAQGEGGEQGDPLMPALFSLGLHPALAAVQERLSAGERLLAFLDDICIVCRPTRVLEVHRILEEECIQVHHGKTHVWNRGGIRPEGIEILTRIARISDPDAVVWRCGDSRSGEGCPCVGSSHWQFRICFGPIKRKIQRATIVVSTDSSSSRLAICLVVTLYLRCHKGQFAVRSWRAAHWASWADF